MRIRLTAVPLFVVCLFPITAMASDPASSASTGAPAAAATLCLSAHGADCAVHADQPGESAPAALSVHCDLYRASFSDCLSRAAGTVVRRDPNAPEAVAAFKISVKDDVTGVSTDTTLLTATTSDISDVVGTLHYSLQTDIADDGSTRVAFHLTGDGVVSGLHDFRVGDSHTVAMDHAMVTIARL